MTALFWQILVLIIVAVVIGMMLGGYVRRYLSASSADQRNAAKRKRVAASPSKAIGAVAASKLGTMKEKALDKMGEAQLEAEAQALAKKTNEDLASQSVEVDKTVLQSMTVEPIEEGAVGSNMASDSDERDEKADKVEETREALVEAVTTGASDAEVTQLGSDYAAASEEGSQSDKVEEPGAPDVIETTQKTEALDEDQMAAALAALPDDASNEDKANAVGAKPALLDMPRDGQADDLKKIKGIGKVLEGKLNDLGVHHLEQIANWTQSEVNWVTTFLSFKGRIEREEWIPQAKGLLAEAGPQGEGDGGSEKPTSAELAAENASSEPSKEAPEAVPEEETEEAPEAVTEAPAEEVDLNADGDVDAEEERIAAAIAALPKDASAEDKANVAGSKPLLLEAPRDGEPDDLKRIKGVGKVIEGKLNDLGIYHFDQVANWSRKEVNWVTTFLSFKGRVDRENWIEQAKDLAAGKDPI